METSMRALVLLVVLGTLLSGARAHEEQRTFSLGGMRRDPEADAAPEEADRDPHVEYEHSHLESGHHHEAPPPPPLLQLPGIQLPALQLPFPLNNQLNHLHSRVVITATKTLFVEVTKRLTRHPICIAVHGILPPCLPLSTEDCGRDAGEADPEDEVWDDGLEEGMYIQPSESIRIPATAGPEEGLLPYEDEGLEEVEMRRHPHARARYLEIRAPTTAASPADLEPSEASEKEEDEARGQDSRKPTPVAAIEEEAAIDTSAAADVRPVQARLNHRRTETVITTKTLWVTKVQKVTDHRVTATLVAQNCVPSDTKIPLCKEYPHHKPKPPHKPYKPYKQEKPHHPAPHITIALPPLHAKPHDHNYDHHPKPYDYDHHHHKPTTPKPYDYDHHHHKPTTPKPYDYDHHHHKPTTPKPYDYDHHHHKPTTPKPYDYVHHHHKPTTPKPYDYDHHHHKPTTPKPHDYVYHHRKPTDPKSHDHDYDDHHKPTVSVHQSYGKPKEQPDVKPVSEKSSSPLELWSEEGSEQGEGEGRSHGQPARVEDAAKPRDDAELKESAKPEKAGTPKKTEQSSKPSNPE